MPIILDVIMPEMDGCRLYEKIKKLDDKITICFLTATDDAYCEILKKNYPNINENCVIDLHFMWLIGLPIMSHPRLSNTQGVICPSDINVLKMFKAALFLPRYTSAIPLTPKPSTLVGSWFNIWLAISIARE